MPADVIRLRPAPVESVAVPEIRALADPRDLRLILNLRADVAEQLRINQAVTSHAVKRPYTRRVEQVYWDTPDYRLGRSGIALALQKAGQKHFQVVHPIREIQTGGRPNTETQVQIQGDRPDLVRLALTAGADPLLVSGLDPAGIIPVFSVDLRRTHWTLRWGDTTLALCLDQGTITSAQGDRSVHQVLLSHLSGPAIGLYDFARSLGRSLPISLARLSPAQKGYRLVAADDWWASANKPMLSPSMTVHEGILAIGRAATAQLRNEVDALAGSQKPERIHQTRVAIRRLRSVLSVFGPVLPTLWRRVLGRELNGLASQLGAAREWDVFLAEILAPLEENLPLEHALSGLRLTGEVLREQAAELARAAVTEDDADHRHVGSSFMDLSLRLAAWFDAGIWPESPSPEAQLWFGQPLAAFAQELLQKRHRKLVKAAHGLIDPRPDELHALRIDAKKLRYTAEFFARLFSPKPAKRYLVALAEIQDILGVINDAAASRNLVQQLCAGSDPGNSHAAGLITGWTAAQAAIARQHFAESWASFTSVKRFWKSPQ